MLETERDEAVQALDRERVGHSTRKPSPLARLRKAIPLPGSMLLLLTVILVSLAMGKYQVALSEIPVFFWQRWFGGAYISPDRMRILNSVLVEIRLPRIFAAALVGSALSASGAAYQAMFVNPLVSPSLLGVLAGAGFGAALGIVYLKTWFGVQIATFIGGLAAVLIAVGIARIYRINTTIMLVLGGIISGALFTSLLSLVKYLSDPYNQLPTIVNWLMGSLTLSDRATVIKTATRASTDRRRSQQDCCRCN